MIRSLRRFAVLLGILAVGAACSDQLAPLDSPLTPTVELGGPYLSLSPAESTVQVLEYARRMNVAKVVFASSAAVYGDVDSLPLGSKSRVNGAPRFPSADA